MAFFDDFFSSSRGPGVIGTGIALVVVVGFGTLYFFVFDEGMRGADKSIEAVIRDQEKEISGLHNSMEHFQGKLVIENDRKQVAKEVEELASQTRIAKGKLDATRRISEKANTDLATLDKNFETYQQNYRDQLRSEAIGKKYAEFKTLSGQVFKDVTITKVDPIGIAFSYADGMSRKDFEDLPTELREHFQYNLAERKKAEAAESAAVEQHNKLVNDATNASNKAQMDEAKRKVAEAKAKAQLDQVQLTAKVSELDKQIQETQRSWDLERSRVQTSGGIVQSATYQTKLKSLNDQRNAAAAKLREVNAILQR